MSMLNMSEGSLCSEAVFGGLDSCSGRAARCFRGCLEEDCRSTNTSGVGDCPRTEFPLLQVHRCKRDAPACSGCLQHVRILRATLWKCAL